MAERKDYTGEIVLISVSITGLTELVILGTCCFLWIEGKEIPTTLAGFLIAFTTYVFITGPNQVKSYLDSMNK